MGDIDNFTAAVGFYIIFCISITYITTVYTKNPCKNRGLLILFGGERVRLAKLLYFTLKYSKSLYKHLNS